LLSAILVLGILLSPLVGLLTDRLGRRRTLVSSLVAWSLAGGLVVLRPSFPVVLALRLVQGAALAGIGVTTVTLIGDTFEGVQRNEVLGVNTAVLSAGAAAFPVVGGALVVVSWSAPFAMYLLGLPIAVLAFLVLEEPLGERESRSLVYLRRVVFAISAREAVVPYGSAFVIDFLLFGAVFTGLPFLLAGTCGLSPVLIGLVVTTGEVASTVAATQNDRFARHLSDYGIVTVGFVATAAGLLGAGLAPTPP
jgi:MFS family permease